MAVTFYISGYLAQFASGTDSIVIHEDSATVAEALSRLWEKHIALRDRVMDETGAVRTHVNIFVDGDSIKYKNGLLTTLTKNSEVYILPAVSGGFDPTNL